MSLMLPPEFEPAPLTDVDPVILRAQGIHILDSELDMGALAMAASNAPTSDVVTVDEGICTHPGLGPAIDNMISELDYLGFSQDGALFDTIAIYKEQLRNDEHLPPGTFVDRLHRDETFQAAIIADHFPSWYYVDPTGQGFSEADFIRAELDVDDGICWDNVRAAPVGKWVFHTEQVPHARSPLAAISDERSAIIYRRFLEL